MDNRYYVYIYKDIDGTPVYVGKGTGDRCRDHIRKAKNYNSKSYNKEFKLWILSYIDNYGFEPMYEIYKDNLTNIDALQLEESLIRIYGRIDIHTGSLFNKTYGGEKCCGRIVSKKERDTKSAWMKLNSPALNSDVKCKLSNRAKNRFLDKSNHPMYGKTHSKTSILQMKMNLPDRSGENNSNHKYVYTIFNDLVSITTKNIRQFCIDNQLLYESVNMKFFRMKTDVIEFKGWTIVRKLK